MDDQFEDSLAKHLTNRKLTEKSFKDLCSFLGFSRKAESLHEISRFVGHLITTLFQERCSLDSSLLCSLSELVEHSRRSRRDSFGSERRSAQWNRSSFRIHGW